MTAATLTRTADIPAYFKETYARARKSVAMADILIGAHVTDARDVDRAGWRQTYLAAGRRSASTATKAAVTALLDVQSGRLDERPHGDGTACKVYYVTRKAARIADVFWEVGLDDAREATALQWRQARLIAGVDAPSEGTRVVVTAILDHRREALS